MTYEELFELARLTREQGFEDYPTRDHLVLSLSPAQLADWLHMLGHDRYYTKMPPKIRNAVYAAAGLSLRAPIARINAINAFLYTDFSKLDLVAMIRQRIADNVTNALLQ